MDTKARDEKRSRLLVSGHDPEAPYQRLSGHGKPVGDIIVSLNHPDLS